METKTTELSLSQRLASDTPLLFKKIGLIATSIIPIGGILIGLKGVPDWVGPVVTAVSTVVALLCSIIVKDTSVLSNPNATIEDYTKVLQDIPNQIQELHAGIQNTVDAIKTGQVKPEVPQVETIIVKEPVKIPSDLLVGGSGISTTV